MERQKVGLPSLHCWLLCSDEVFTLFLTFLIYCAVNPTFYVLTNTSPSVQCSYLTFYLWKECCFLHQNMKEKLIGLSTCQIYKDGFCNFFNFVTFDGKVSAGSLILQSKLISHLSNCDNLQIEYFPQNTRLWHFPPQDLWHLLPLGQSRPMASTA